ncbi:MAG: BatD family protein [Planctomycetaceae bacterium]
MNIHNVLELKRLLCLSASVTLCCVAAAGEVNADEVRSTTDSIQATVTSNVSSSTMQVAEPLTLELTVTASVGSQVDFPSVGKSLGDFDVTDQTDRADVPSADNGNQRVWTRRLTLESIVTGDLEIPELEILVRNSVGSQTLKSAAIPVRVTSVLEDRADPTQFRDIQSVVDVTVPQPASRAWFWWTLGGLGGTAAASLLFAAVAKRKTWMTPKAWAIRELDELRNSDAMKSTDSETVTENLTTILRDYLELQFGIAAPVQTTTELLQVVETGRYMSPETTKGFGELLEHSDLARFAGLQLTHAELSKAIDDAQRLIEQTSHELQMPLENVVRNQ